MKSTQAKGRIIAVWGSPGSGKSILAAKIALQLAEKGIGTALILADGTAPMMSCLAHPSKLSAEHSLGSLFATPALHEKIVAYHSNPAGEPEFLSVYGYRKGESRFSFPTPTPEQAAKYLEILRSLYDMVVVDCCTDVAGDLITAQALHDGDAVIRLQENTLKSVNCLSTQLSLLGDHAGFHPDRHIKVLTQSRPPHSAKIPSIPNIPHKLPYSEEIEEQFLLGEILSQSESPGGRAYEKSVHALSKVALKEIEKQLKQK